MTKTIEEVLLLFFFLLTPTMIAWQAAKGRPRRWKPSTYLILFFLLLVLDAPILLLLYLTPKSSSEFSALDFVSDLAVIVFGAAWGCLFAAIARGRWRKEKKSTGDV